MKNMLRTLMDKSHISSFGTNMPTLVEVRGGLDDSLPLFTVTSISSGRWFGGTF
jgi:hypothetical protein